MPPRRRLEFRDFDQVRADVDRLRQFGYHPLGRWDLAQICDHLAYFVQASLDGAEYRIPWWVRYFFGRAILNRLLQRGFKPGMRTPQNPLPAPGGDEYLAVRRLDESLTQFERHAGPFAPSPLFGELTADEWRRLHLLHAAHHLAFLQPRE